MPYYSQEILHKKKNLSKDFKDTTNSCTYYVCILQHTSDLDSLPMYHNVTGSSRGATVPRPHPLTGRDEVAS